MNVTLFIGTSFIHSVHCYLLIVDCICSDIKPENILLVSKDNDVDLKLADFGFAVQSAGPPSIKQQAGTPGYISPEVIEGKPHGKHHIVQFSI